MRIALTITTLMFSFAAEAQPQNLPDLTSPTEIGRVTLYKSVQPLSWLQPTAFESEFLCTGGGGEYSTCNVRVYNRLNEAERAELERIAQANGLGVVQFSSVDSSIVNGIYEGFEGLPTDLAGSSQSLGTLAMTDGKFPYANYAFRIKKDRKGEIESLYQSDRLGAFKVQFNVAAQRTETYLAIRDGNCLKSHLSSVRGGLGRSEVNSLLTGAIKACGVKSLNLDEDEIAGFLRVHLRNTFFTYGFFSGYELKAAEVAKIAPIYVIENHVAAGLTLKCLMELRLAQGSAAKTQCQTVER